MGYGLRPETDRGILHENRELPVQVERSRQESPSSTERNLAKVEAKDAPDRPCNLQAVATDQLQGMRISHVPGIRHETGGQAGRTEGLPVRHRRVEIQTRSRLRSTDPPY